MTYRLATTAADFEAIHQLNYRTFVEEIPQHSPNSLRRLVDRFHDQNTYVIAKDGDQLVGMVAGRCARPFSLDQKLPALDDYLPPHRKAVEIRLLAVMSAYRKTSVFVRLVAVLADHFKAEGCDLALISGTVRQRRLYGHLGFRPFAAPVGTPDALYQPMYLTLDALSAVTALQPRAHTLATFLPGPVPLRTEVRSAFGRPALSHRDPSFAAMLLETRQALSSLTGKSHASVMVGTGTLANDAIAAQISRLGGRVLILTNGEFGERLVDHAARFPLPMVVERREWGEPFDWAVARRKACECRPAWIWAVLSETSTGMLNSLEELRTLASSAGAELCLDAVSAIGLLPTDLARVRFASAVSGKGLAAFPGLAIVLHDGRLAPAGRIPRYLDLAQYESDGGVPYTQSSNLLSAMHCALTTTRWADKFERIRSSDRLLRANLHAHGFTPLANGSDAVPGVLTLELPAHCPSARVASALAAKGIGIAWQSEYLKRRNWIQICLMGAFDDRALERLPGFLSAALASLSTCKSAATSTQRLTPYSA